MAWTSSKGWNRKGWNVAAAAVADGLAVNWSNSGNGGSGVTSFSASAGGNVINQFDLVLIAVIATDASGASAKTIASSGYTAIQQFPSGTNNSQNVCVLWKIAGASESTTPTVTVASGGSTGYEWMMLTISGTHQTTPINVSASQANHTASNGTDEIAPTITPLRADTTLFNLYTSWDTGQTWTLPGGQVSAALSTGHRLQLAKEFPVAASATGTRTATSSLSSSGDGFSLAITPP